MLYLDYLATTPINPKVQNVLVQSLHKNFANSSSLHSCGIQAQKSVREAQMELADYIGAEPSEIIFTSGATEANNLFIKGYSLANKHKGNHLITSTIEHKCVLNIFSYLERCGFEVTYIAPDKNGIVSTDSLIAAIQKNTLLVSIMHVNNELGTINSIRDLGAICYKRDIKFHTDTAQSFGKISIDVIDDNIDSLSVSAHKLGGPKGIGFCYIQNARENNIEPCIHGSGHQNGLRGGTLPTSLISGLAEATKSFEYNKDNLLHVREVFLKSLQDKKVDYMVNGLHTIPNALSITFKSEDIARKLVANKDVCLSQGSACTSKEIMPSHVLSAIGLSPEEARKTFRISFVDEKLLELLHYI